MISAFYAVLVVFILNEIYHFLNRKRLDLLFKNKDVDQMRKMDIIYYLAKVAAVIWPMIGLFSSMWPMFLALIVAGLLQFAFYHISEKSYSVYSAFHPLIKVSIYVAILAMKFIR
jgi:hypothetical protein